MNNQLIDVRCPLPSLDKLKKGEACSKLIVQVAPGSAGKAYCPRHHQHFEFQVDDPNSFDNSFGAAVSAESKPTF
jgi:hypothetical protein